MQKEAFEPTGLIPRSIIRTFDRFIQQLLPGTEKIAIQEYQVSRYQILVSIKSLLTLICIPLLVNYTVKYFLLTPLTEHFWNSSQGEIFLNEYQEKRAFIEMQDFSDKIFFESLIKDTNPKVMQSKVLHYPTQSVAQEECTPEVWQGEAFYPEEHALYALGFTNPLGLHSFGIQTQRVMQSFALQRKTQYSALQGIPAAYQKTKFFGNNGFLFQKGLTKSEQSSTSLPPSVHHSVYFTRQNARKMKFLQSEDSHSLYKLESHETTPLRCLQKTSFFVSPVKSEALRFTLRAEGDSEALHHPLGSLRAEGVQTQRVCKDPRICIPIGIQNPRVCKAYSFGIQNPRVCKAYSDPLDLHSIQNIPYKNTDVQNEVLDENGNSMLYNPYFLSARKELQSLQSETLLEKENNLQTKFIVKSLEIAYTYNKQSILAITSLLGDFLTFFTVYLLFLWMKPQIIILKSFLTESIYSLSDTTKSFLLILGMDLLVGFHSPRGWEIVLENVLRHLGLPENENFILLFVALFPVFLDTVFKYWIFRYLNKISPSTVVTYHSMLE